MRTARECERSRASYESANLTASLPGWNLKKRIDLICKNTETAGTLKLEEWWAPLPSLEPVGRALAELRTLSLRRHSCSSARASQDFIFTALAACAPT